MKILLVEDHESTLNVLAKLLRKEGHHVLTAMTMQRGADLLREGFDLLISDLGLPDGSGLELIRHMPPGGRIPAIALSGFGMDHDIGASREAGFDAHVIKPVTMGRLNEAIREVMRDKR